MEAEAAPPAADAAAAAPPAAEAAQPQVVMQKKTRVKRTNLTVDATGVAGWSLQQQNEFFEKEVRIRFPIRCCVCFQYGCLGIIYTMCLVPLTP